MAWPVITPVTAAEPISAGHTDLDLWDLLVQFPYAIRERVRASGGGRWFPAVSRIFYQGTITGFVDNGDGTSTAMVADTFCVDGIAPDPWFTPCVDTADSSVPTTFHAAIDDDDATVAVGNLTVTGHGTHTVTFSLRAANLVTAKQWANVSDAVGRLLVITRPEPWWNHPDRFLPWPNAPTYFTATVLSNTATTIRVDQTSFSPGQWNGYEIMVFDSAGVLHRLTVTDTQTDTTGAHPVGVLTFASIGTAALAGQTFYIIKAGGRFMSGRPKPYPFQWYSGLMDAGVLSHAADDTLAPIPVSPQVYTTPYDHDETGLSDCVTTVSADTLLDSDPKTPEQAKCVTPDHFENPTVTKTFRYFQAVLDASLCYQYLPQATPQGRNKITAFAGFAPATYFQAFGCDSWSGTVGGTTVTVDVSGWEPRDSYVIYWALKDVDGGVPNGQTGTATITSGGGWTFGSFGSGEVGKTVVVSAGWPRFWEQMIGRAYTSHVWVPDEDPDNPGVYFTTPTEPRPGETAGPGRIVSVAAFTHYAVNGEGPRGESSDSHDLFVNGDLARYVAENYWDTTTTYSAADTTPAAFYDRSFEGERNTAAQGKRVAALSGTVDAANVTARRLVDSTKDWYNYDFYGNAVIKTFTGTDSISGTSVTLGSQSASAMFSGTSTLMVLQSIEGQTGTDAHGNPIWDAHLITAQSGDVLTLTTAMPSVSNWRIQFASPASSLAGGRKVKLTAYDSSGTAIGSPQTVTLDGNGQHELFFPTITIPGGVDHWTYEIQELQPGHVYERVSGDWSDKVSGSDTIRRGVTTPQDFHKNSRENLAHIRKAYGRVCPHDLMQPVMEKLYDAINVLKYRRVTGGFTAHPDPTSAPINNSFSWTTGSAYWSNVCDASDPHNCRECDTGNPYGGSSPGPDMEAYLDTRGSGTSVEGQSPFSSTNVQFNTGSGENQATANTAASYLKITDIPGYGMVPTPGIQAWLYASLDGSTNCSYAGDCATSAIPDSFTANYTAVVCLDWANVSGFSVYPDGTAYSGLIGSTSRPEWPATLACPAASPCTPANPGGDTPSGGGAGGWQTDAHAEIATYPFLYSA